MTSQTKPLLPQSACTGAFVTHKLPFSTGTRLREISTYISNGSGVAVNDLDRDGDPDLVFASVDSNSAILWNEGSLHFEEQTLEAQFARGVATVDVDGDGWLDIVFTHRGLEPPTWLRNEGAEGEENPEFRTRNLLPGVDSYAYAMGWADLNGDGLLDLVTGSYGAELKQHGIDEPERDDKAGVFLYLQKDGQFIPQQLDARSEALSIALLDLNQDGRSDIWVANDFALQDLVWLADGEQWQPAKPFAVTSHSTMSLEWGSLDNRGAESLFTTDMNPYDISTQNIARWLPMMAQMGDHRESGDPQIMANTLQVRDARGEWRNEALQLGVESSGWSWASKFGDLDQDGYLDLYVVNGMIAYDMFGHLDNGELVEENQAYRNRGDGSFERAPQWNLGSTASGRGMVMADMDGDGDLDIVVNNLRGMAELHENQLCSGERIEVELFWQGSNDPFAIGAKIALHTSLGIMLRDVRASGGYLSGDGVRLHFGIPEGTEISRLEVTWQDGAVSVLEGVQPGNRYSVVR